MRVGGIVLLVVVPVMAPFAKSFGVPKIAWEPLVGIAVCSGLFLLFR
jgi:hypothetical protein